MIYEGLIMTELAANISHGQYRQTAMRYDAVAHDIKATDAFMAQDDLLTAPLRSLASDNSPNLRAKHHIGGHPTTMTLDADWLPTGNQCAHHTASYTTTRAGTTPVPRPARKESCRGHWVRVGRP